MKTFVQQIIANLSPDEIVSLAKREIQRQLVNTCRETRRRGKNPKDQVAHKAQSFIRDADKAARFSEDLRNTYGADARNVVTRSVRSLTSFEDFVKEATAPKDRPLSQDGPRVAKLPHGAY